jgi:hypothetical protein
MSLLRVLITALAVLAGSVPALAAELLFGSMQMQWPDGYALTGAAKSPFELSGPGGSKVLISVMRRTNEGVGPDQEELARTGEGFLRPQAEKAGKIVIPLDRATLPDGSLLLFIAAQKTGFFSSGCLLLYMVISPGGRLGFVTVEAKGDAAEEHGKVLPLFQSVKWLPS